MMKVKIEFDTSIDSDFVLFGMSDSDIAASILEWIADAFKHNVIAQYNMIIDDNLVNVGMFSVEKDK